MTARGTTSPVKGRPRPVVQYDRASNRVAEYPSARAAMRATGVDLANLCNVANSKDGHRTAGGYVWRWADDSEHLFREHRRTGDVSIRNRLMERHLDLVRYHAGRLHAKLPPEVQLDDLISAGTFGLIDAVRGFNPDRGFAFSTYAGRRIRGAMLDWIRDRDWVPRLVRHRAGIVGRAAEALRQELGREPTRHELEARLAADGDAAKVVADAAVPLVASLSRKCFETDANKDVTELDTLADRTAVDPASDQGHTSLRDVLLKHFSLTRALIVRLYYVDGLPLSEVGEALGGLSESRISQLHSLVLNALKERYGERLFDLIGDGRAA